MGGGGGCQTVGTGEPFQLAGRWLHSGGSLIEISIADDCVAIIHPISGTVTIPLDKFLVGNVVNYKVSCPVTTPYLTLL